MVTGSLGSVCVSDFCLFDQITDRNNLRGAGFVLAHSLEGTHHEGESMAIGMQVAEFCTVACHISVDQKAEYSGYKQGSAPGLKVCR